MMIDLNEKKISLQEALNLALEGDTILLEDKTYFEKLVIDKKKITLLGRKNSTISFNASHGTILPEAMGGDGVRTYGTTGSATVRVLKGADGFTAKNITFVNSFKRGNQKNGQAVAFKSEINNLRIENCRFISDQDTLYIDYGKNNLVVDSYIEGDIDFIFGSADCIFHNCEIKAKNVVGIAYFTAPDTYQSNLYGFIFHQCKFFSEENLDTYLGRGWYPSGATEPVFPKEYLIQCTIDANVKLDLIKMRPTDPKLHELILQDCVQNENIFSTGKIDKSVMQYVEDSLSDF